MKLATSALPTPSALAIATAVGIMPKVRDEDFELYDDNECKLMQFQQMSFVCTMEESLIAFYGVELTKVQLEGLDLIYKTTQPWILGHVIGELIGLISNEGFKGKDAVQAAELILQNLIKDGLVDKESAAKLVVNMYGQQNSENDGNKPKEVA